MVNFFMLSLEKVLLRSLFLMNGLIYELSTFRDELNGLIYELST